MTDLKIDPPRAAVLVVDVQDKLAMAMPEADRLACEKNVVILVELARRKGMPVVVSEQYPKGLGATVKAVADALAAPGLDVRRLEKMEFACTEAAPFEGILAALGRRQWIVAGMETHVCVYQTVRGLVARGAQVQVPRDAVCSRTPENRNVGLALMERAGAVVTSTEAVLFDALQCAGTDDFKALSRLVR